jgi:hypothetical protein
MDICICKDSTVYNLLYSNRTECPVSLAVALQTVSVAVSVQVVLAAIAVQVVLVSVPMQLVTVPVRVRAIAVLCSCSCT